MRSKNLVVLAVLTFTSGAWATSGLRHLECKNGNKPLSYELVIDVVTGGGLAGGLAEVKQSSPVALYAPVGYYIQTNVKGNPGAPQATVYEAEGFSLTIERIQPSDLPAGINRASVVSRNIQSGKAVEVQCREK